MVNGMKLEDWMEENSKTSKQQLQSSRVRNLIADRPQRWHEDSCTLISAMLNYHRIGTARRPIFPAAAVYVASDRRQSCREMCRLACQKTFSKKKPLLT